MTKSPQRIVILNLFQDLENTSLIRTISTNTQKKILSDFPFSKKKSSLKKMEEFLNKNFAYAIVGSSKNPEKYGNIVLRKLNFLGYKCIPINPKEEKIEGLKVFPSLKDCSEKIDIAVFILPPEKTYKILPELKIKNIKKAWFQPGSFDEKVLEFCKKNNIQNIHEFCIMVVASQKN